MCKILKLGNEWCHNGCDFGCRLFYSSFESKKSAFTEVRPHSA